MKLSDLREAQSACISDILGDDAVSLRLMEMGLLEGEPIRCLRVAPLGDPIEYEVRGYRISLRRTEAERVAITPPTDS